MPEDPRPLSEIEFRDDVTVELVKASADDSDVVWAARVSTAGEASIAAREQDPERNAGLIRYLMRDRHGTPFEHNSFTFLVSAPIFVFREFMRHRVGWCVTGDTEITTESVGARSGRTIRRVRIDGLFDRWQNGVTDSMGRVRHLQSVRRQQVRVLNEETLLFERAPIVDVIHCGVKPVMTLRTVSGKTLRCTSDHALFTNEGWVKAGDLEPSHLLAVVGRRAINAGRQYPPACHREKTNYEQRLVKRGSTSGARFEPYQRVGAVDEAETYDLSVAGPWHNFLANGIVVHNSYNEESGRYRELKPVFYVPGPTRRLVQQGKPGAYEFVDGSPEQHKLVTEVTEEACRQAYHAYLEMLDAGVAREVARGVLPVATFSSMYATCNARSLMHFLSLRTKHPESTFPSFPQREIEMVAEGMEQHFARLMPITHAAFETFGRVAP